MWDMRSKHDPDGYGMNIKYLENFMAANLGILEKGADIPKGRTDIQFFQ